jgi:hypothetical protein
MILAIDPGTRTGWATSDGRSGSIALWREPRKGKPGRPARYAKKDGRLLAPAVAEVPPVDDGSKDTRLLRLLRWLEIHSGVLSHVVFEGSDGFIRGQPAVRCANELRGVVKLWCLRMGVPYTQVEPGDLKRFATGRTNAKKPDMIAAAKARLGYTGDDEDECDAIWLREWARTFVQDAARVSA